MSRALPSALVVLFLACGDATPPKTLEETAFASSLGVDLSISQKLPSGMYIRELSEGTGTEAVNGQRVSMHYVGWLVDGTRFDGNETKGEDGTYTKPAFSFVLGAGTVIQGWEFGVPGMKGGGDRQLIIPSGLGYGASGAGNVIPPNAHLVFNVHLD